MYLKVSISIYSILFGFWGATQNVSENPEIGQLLTESEKYLSTDLEHAKGSIDAGIELCEREDNLKGKLSFTRMLGIWHLYSGDSESAEHVFRDGYKKSTRYFYMEMASSFSNNIGLVKQRLGQLDSARYYYQISGNIDKSIGNIEGVVKSKGNIAITYRREHNYPKSIELLFECMHLIESNNSLDKMKPIVLINIGNNFFSIEDYDKALEYSLLAQQMLSDTDVRASILNLDNITETYRVKGDLLNAEKYLKMLDQKVDNTEIPEFHILNRKAKAFFLLDRADYQECIKQCREGMRLSEEHSDGRWLWSLNYCLGEASFRLGRYSDAVSAFTTALEKGRATGKEKLVLGVLKNLGKAYEKLGRDDLAYKYILESTDLEDSLVPINRRNAVQRLEVEYNIAWLERRNRVSESKLKQSQVKIQSQKNEKSKIMMLALVIGFVVILVVIFFIILFLRSNKRKAENASELVFQERLIRTMNRSISVKLLGGKVKRKEVLKLKEVIFMERGGTDKVNYEFLRFKLKEHEQVGKNSYLVYTTSAKKYVRLGSAAELLRTELKDSSLVLVRSNLIVNLSCIREENGVFTLVTREWDDVDNKMIDKGFILKMSLDKKIHSNFTMRFRDYQKYIS